MLSLFSDLLKNENYTNSDVVNYEKLIENSGLLERSLNSYVNRYKNAIDIHSITTNDNLNISDNFTNFVNFNLHVQK
jgi:hypothetical protein